jgi:hypothetical protein
VPKIISRTPDLQVRPELMSTNLQERVTFSLHDASAGWTLTPMPAH